MASIPDTAPVSQVEECLKFVTHPNKIRDPPHINIPLNSTNGAPYFDNCKFNTMAQENMSCIHHPFHYFFKPKNAELVLIVKNGHRIVLLSLKFTICLAFP